MLGMQNVRQSECMIVNKDYLTKILKLIYAFGLVNNSLEGTAFELLFFLLYNQKYTSFDMKLLVNLIHITCNKRQECVLLASPHIRNFYQYFNRIANIQSHCVSITICKTCRREKYDLFWMMNSWCLIYNFTDLEPIKYSPPYNDTVKTYWSTFSF